MLIEDLQSIMKCFGFAILLVHITNACLEPGATTVHIQNYEGPIYVSPGENRLTTSNQASHCDNRYPATTSQASHCDNRYPATTSLTPHCDNRYPATTTQAPHCDNRYPTLCNYDSQPNILHNSVPYHQTVCEADCKCVTKQQSYVPIAVNSVPQNTCTPGYCSSQYPEGYNNGYLCPDTNCPETDVSTPRISETLIPLLKTYLSQIGGCGCSKPHTCQCGRKYSQCYSK